MNSSRVIQSIAVFGDSYGLPITIKNLPVDIIKCIVCAKVRPNDFSNVERIANHLKVPLLVQPKIDDPDYGDFVIEFSQIRPDLIVCHSYSMIIRNDILNLAKNGGVNVHQSILPKNRGPNPIQWSLIRGDPEAGVTIHYISERIDSGDIIGQEKIKISDHDTWVTLREKVTDLTDLLLRKHFPSILLGVNSRIPQNESEASSNPRLGPESPLIDFRKMSDVEIFNLIRAQVAPLRGAFINTPERRIYFTTYKKLEEVKEIRMQFESQAINSENGSIFPRRQ